MRYRLRTLLILLAILPPLLAWGWHEWQEHLERQRMAELLRPRQGMTYTPQELAQLKAEYDKRVPPKPVASNDQ